MTTTAEALLILSTWLDESPANAARDPEARTWGRIAKVAEEGGEVVSAYISYTQQNPRRTRRSPISDVEDELLDVAITALGAIVHLRGNDPAFNPLDLLDIKVQGVIDRVGLG